MRRIAALVAVLAVAGCGSTRGATAPPATQASTSAPPTTTVSALGQLETVEQHFEAAVVSIPAEAQITSLDQYTPLFHAASNAEAGLRLVAWPAAAQTAAAALEDELVRLQTAPTKLAVGLGVLTVQIDDSTLRLALGQPDGSGPTFTLP